VPLPPLTHWQAWGGVVGMAVITQGCGHTLQSAALKHIRASIVGFSTLLEPVTATALAAVAFGERIGAQSALGVLLVLGSLAWALRSTQAIDTGGKTG
jgi:drug/metabolite transporter (DMT)-like permease